MTENNQNSHILSTYISKKTFANPALQQALQDYIRFIPGVSFSDVSSETRLRDGITVDGVREHFDSQVEPEHYAFDSNEESLKYIYTSEETMPDSENPYMATIYFYFMDRRLFYAEVRMQVDSIDEKNFVPEDVIESLITEKNQLADLEEIQPQTYGLAQMYMNDEMVYELFIPYIGNDGQEYAAFFLIKDEKVQKSYTSLLENEFKAEENTLMRNLLRYETYERRAKATVEIQKYANDISHPLDSFVSVQTLENPAAQLAYQGLKQVWHDFSLTNFEPGQLKGATLQHVREQFHGQREPAHIIATEKEEYLIYTFGSEQKNPTTGDNRKAELKLYFYEDILVYTDVFSLDSFFYQKELPDFEKSLKDFSKGTGLEVLAEEEPITMGLGQFCLNDETYLLLMMPQVSKNKGIMIVNYVLKDNKVYKAFANDYTSVKETLRNAMAQTFVRLTK